MTEAQRWAKRRNFAKFRLKGVLSALACDDHFTPRECGLLESARVMINEVIDEWENSTPQSKRLWMRHADEAKQRRDGSPLRRVPPKRYR